MFPDPAEFIVFRSPGKGADDEKEEAADAVVAEAAANVEAMAGGVESESTV